MNACLRRGRTPNEGDRCRWSSTRVLWSAPMSMLDCRRWTQTRNDVSNDISDLYHSRLSVTTCNIFTSTLRRVAKKFAINSVANAWETVRNTKSQTLIEKKYSFHHLDDVKLSAFSAFLRASPNNGMINGENEGNWFSSQFVWRQGARHNRELLWRSTNLLDGVELRAKEGTWAAILCELQQQQQPRTEVLSLASRMCVCIRCCEQSGRREAAVRW